MHGIIGAIIVIGYIALYDIVAVYLSSMRAGPASSEKLIIRAVSIALVVFACAALFLTGYFFAVGAFLF